MASGTGTDTPAIANMRLMKSTGSGRCGRACHHPELARTRNRPRVAAGRTHSSVVGLPAPPVAAELGRPTAPCTRTQAFPRNSSECRGLSCLSLIIPFVRSKTQTKGVFFPRGRVLPPAPLSAPLTHAGRGLEYHQQHPGSQPLHVPPSCSLLPAQCTVHVVLTGTRRTPC